MHGLGLELHCWAAIQVHDDKSIAYTHRLLDQIVRSNTEPADLNMGMKDSLTHSHGLIDASHVLISALPIIDSSRASWLAGKCRQAVSMPCVHV